VTRPRLDRWFERLFDDPDPGRLGTGWVSGTASVFLGATALGGVVVLHFPELFSTARFRALYPVGLLRAALLAVIALGFVLGLASLWLRRRKVLGLTGCALSLTAVLLGGGQAGAGRAAGSGAPASATLGLDWFLLNLLLLALLFVPLERLFAKRPRQSPFRPEWTTDGVHFFVSHVLVQALSFLILLPATAVGRLVHPHALQELVRSQPALLQFLEVLVVADLAQYGIHRAFHRVSWLWPFHAVHHSSRDLDWLAGSRLHLLDAVSTRALVLVPLSLLGFAEGALHAYLVFVSFHAVFIHANVRFRLRALEPFLVTPRFHHWHHAAEEAARDRNFAVHLPWLDTCFGSRYLPPEAWPETYGLAGNPVPGDYLGQLVYPLPGRGGARA